MNSVVSKRRLGVALGMSKSRPEFPGSNRYGPFAAADVLVREEPDEDEDEETDDSNEEDDDEDEGYSE